MRSFIVVLLTLIAAGCATEAPEGAGANSAEAASASEARAERLSRIADREAARVFGTVLDSIAPDNGWERTRYIAFDRTSGETMRSHRWDRFEGDYWLRGTVDGEELTAIFNVNRPVESARIWFGGEELTDPEQIETLANRAYSWFINDTYWIVFPYKWDDPGVDLRYLGEMEEWGRTWEAVELTFDAVGLTPQNRYRAFVDPDSGMFELWQYFANADDDEPRFTNRWTDWRRSGPLVLSLRRELEDGTRGVYFENVTASTEVPRGAFAAP